MKAGVEKLQGKLADLEAERAAMLGNGSASPVADTSGASSTLSQNTVNPAQLADLREELESISAKVSKAETAAKTAQEKGLPTAEKMFAGVEKLRAKQQEAQAAYVAAGGELETTAEAVAE